MTSSIFGGRGRRQVLPTTALAQRSIPVSTVQQLKNAIGSVARVAAASADPLSSFGTEIVVQAPLRLDAPIIIPALCAGIVIRSIGNVPIMSQGLVSTLFELHAPYATLRDLFVFVDTANAPTDRFGCFIKPGVWESGLGPFSCRVENCDVWADAFYSDAGPSFDLETWHVRGNRFEMGSNLVPAIDGAFSKSVFAENDFHGCTRVIKLEALATGECRIANNSLNNGTVDTSASGGHNTVIGNALLGAGSAFAATDVHAGLNT